jgi:tetratricopeptide (TPR) repeat protein
MTRMLVGKTWLRNLVGTVSASVAVFFVQCGLGTVTKGSDAPAKLACPAEALALKAEAYRFYERALECGRQGRYAEAVADYTESLRLDPTFASAYLNRAWASGQLGHFDRMVADCTEAAGLDRDCALVYVDRAWAYAQLGRYDLAVRDATEALRLEPGLPQAEATRTLALARKSAPAAEGLCQP